MSQCTGQARRLVLAAAACAAAALTAAPPPADAHDCSGFDGTCGAQFHTDTTIAGGKQVGDVVSCRAGEAHASPGEPTYTGRFQRGGTPIEGSDFTGPGATYTLTDADVGFHVVCTTEARHEKGDAISTSSWHGPITARPAPGPCAAERRGTDRAETISGTSDGDRLLGLGGDDVLRGLAGPDCLSGGPGDDVLSGGGDGDRLSGGPGADRLVGGAGRNSISGGPGGDGIDAANGQRDRIDCGPGRDRVRADRADVVRGCERIRRA